MSDANPMTKDELARAIVIAAKAIYAAEAKGPGRDATEARTRHAALLAQYEALSGTSGHARAPSAASPSGVPWCAARCDADGRLIPGR